MTQNQGANERPDDMFDVAIIGTGIAGGTLGWILAHAGLKVVMIEREHHPKFAVGESTIPQTSMNFSFLSERFGIPELGHLSHFHTLNEHVTETCGIKRGFNYIYHYFGKPQNPDQQNQTVLNPECHLYRQEVDAYVTFKAVSAGAALHQRTEVKTVEIDGAGVRLETSKGLFKARYVVDAAGPGSPLAKMFDLRDKPTRCKSHVRSLFTHMIDVTLYHEQHPYQTVPSPLGEGTLHHIFDGGWIWVIPFNNHPGAKNPLCSVGIQLDERFPNNGLKPEQEWNDWLQKMPSAAAQFTKAKSVREWISVDRLQYSSKRTTGNRFCILGHAAGFIDPLYSRGLTNTTEAINALAPILIKAVKDDDFSEDRFAFVETLQRNALDRNDQLVRCSYLSWRGGYELWNAWFRMWAVCVMQGGLRLKGLLAKYKETHDPAFLPDAYPPSAFYGGDPDNIPLSARYRDFYDGIVEKMYAYGEGKLDSAVVIREIYDGLREGDFVDKKFKIWNDERRYVKLAIP